MQSLRTFDINIAGLSNNRHEFEYVIDDTFFTYFEQSLVQKGSLNVTVSMEKSSTMMNVTFIIDGTVELTCDRSLEDFDHKIASENAIVFKYAEEEGEINDELVHIGYDQDKLNVAQYIYEFIGINIPYKKLHPKYIEEDAEDENTGEYIPIYIEEDNSASTSIDPRWQQLKDKFK